MWCHYVCIGHWHNYFLQHEQALWSNVVFLSLVSLANAGWGCADVGDSATFVIAVTFLFLIRNKEQGTRNKEQGARNKEQGTRNKEQGTRNKEHRTRNKEQGTRNKEQGKGKNKHEYKGFLSNL
jgi:hypothetical protein